MRARLSVLFLLCALVLSYSNAVWAADEPTPTPTKPAEPKKPDAPDPLVDHTAPNRPVDHDEQKEDPNKEEKISFLMDHFPLVRKDVDDFFYPKIMQDSKTAGLIFGELMGSIPRTEKEKIKKAIEERFGTDEKKKSEDFTKFYGFILDGVEYDLNTNTWKGDGDKDFRAAYEKSRKKKQEDSEAYKKLVEDMKSSDPKKRETARAELNKLGFDQRTLANFAVSNYSQKAFDPKTLDKDQKDRASTAIIAAADEKNGKLYVPLTYKDSSGDVALYVGEANNANPKYAAWALQGLKAKGWENVVPGNIGSIPTDPKSIFGPKTGPEGTYVLADQTDEKSWAPIPPPATPPATPGAPPAGAAPVYASLMTKMADKTTHGGVACAKCHAGILSYAGGVLTKGKTAITEKSQLDGMDEKMDKLIGQLKAKQHANSPNADLKALQAWYDSLK